MNYLKHLGLRELPFGITPDTTYFFASRSIQEALNTLLVAAYNGEGFIKIVGEVGHGKTMLCRTFLASLRETESLPAKARGGLNFGTAFVTAYLPNPYLDPRGSRFGFGMYALTQPGATVDRNLRQSSVLPVPTSPVILMNPSPFETATSRVFRASWMLREAKK